MGTLFLVMENLRRILQIFDAGFILNFGLKLYNL